MTNPASEKALPDVALTSRSSHSTTLDWVGMSGIALPLVIKDVNEPEQRIDAKVQTYVNLNNPQVKGIHMSRLYLLLMQYAEKEVVTVAGLREFLSHLLDSHHDISDCANLNIDFDYLIKKPALKSQFAGWKDYPVTVNGFLENGKVVIELSVKVPYSSTCPCSAALARQLIQEQFSKDFDGRADISVDEVESWLRSEKGTFATPHSQRSTAHVVVRLDESVELFPISELVNVIENALQTPVQTAVKREDEQEFARLNGHNLMFVEDAARRVKNALNQQSDYLDFWLRVEHYESLHAHDAVSITTKGVEGGFQPHLHR
ncbi:GTP cyclohydrolase FolE2 [Litoribrevibacter albus]|uniref:GTP cyclohydrolase FolE2 n=1 Tax=Litoribrevibacter albus TaxID=1473156 RepID=A0AA37S9J8_9GAMM|nr:GTP cyclohydrolase FolE2 [Litoribrevibacter albus]GLQ30679.1 GTP cyclohydrolase FolE2 [Litoribrevibacter albus]